jgi:hypothetical protein
MEELASNWGNGKRKIKEIEFFMSERKFFFLFHLAALQYFTMNANI